MTRSLYWKPHKPNQMECLNKCIPLMDAIQNIFNYEKAILDHTHMNPLFWLSQSVSSPQAEEINKLIDLIKEYDAIEVEIRR